MSVTPTTDSITSLADLHTQALCIVARFNREHSAVAGEDCLFVSRLRADGLRDWQIACAIHAVENTCHDCWDAPARCHCANGE